MAGNRKYSDADIADAIKGSGGLITVIAQRLKCSRTTIVTRIKESAELSELLAEEKETLKDIAEQTIIRSITGGNTSDAKWYLAHQARERGYGERLEISGPDGKPINAMSNDELIEFIRSFNPEQEATDSSSSGS